MRIQDIAAVVSPANVALVTTNETIVVTSPPCRVNRQSAVFLIIAFVEVLAGTGTVSLLPRIRRGVTLSDPIVNEPNNVIADVVASASNQVFFFAMDTGTNITEQQYSLTIAQTAASGNGTSLQAGIFVVAV